MSAQVQKMLFEMQSQLQRQQGDLANANGVHEDLTGRNKAIDLTLQEVNESGQSEVWQGCGKAFLREDKSQFVEELEKEKKGNAELLGDIEKKKKYLEKSIGTTVDAMNKVLDQVEMLSKGR